MNDDSSTPDDPAQPTAPDASSAEKMAKEVNAFDETQSYEEQQRASAVAVGLPAAFGRYEVRGFLGKGHFGAVYLGYDERLDRLVAIKVTQATKKDSASSFEQALQEARQLAKLKHSNIVTVHDADIEDGQFYIVSDYIEGTSLRNLIRERSLSWQESAYVVSALAGALAHAHSQSMIHRDVKPGNIIMQADTTPILVDFGLALHEETTSSERGRIQGTPAYMSPEQTKGRAHRIDGRTDIFSLGVVLYQLLCGRRPFRAGDFDELVREICEDEPQPPRQIVPEIPAELETICLNAMQKQINDRYTTASDMADALRLTLASHEAATTSTAPAASVAPVSMSISRSASQSTRACRNCGLDNPADFQFCGKCGTPLSLLPDESLVESQDSRFADVGPSSVVKRLHEAERRQVTVLFCQLIDSDAPSELTDPEELREILRDYQDTCAEVARQFSGHIAQYVGEGLLVYFGFPLAFEDAAQRAVRAALEMLSAVANLNERRQRAHGVALDITVGIHTGLVVAEQRSDASLSHQVSVIGDAPKIAAGLEGLAEPNCVLISGATERLVSGIAACRSLGPKSLRGFAREIEVYQVDGQRAAGDGASATLIGREHEIGLLVERWESVKAGAGQAVLLSGEAGIGKSRLLQVLKEQISHQPHIRAECRCSPYHSASAYFPIIDLLHRMMRVGRDDEPAAALRNLERWLQEYHLQSEQYVPLIAPLLSLPLDNRYEPFVLTPDQRKQQTEAALLSITAAMAAARPLLFIVEDLHWVDPSTQDVLSQMVECGPHHSILTVFTFRPSFSPPWPMRSHLSQLSLSHLNPQQAARLAVATAGGRQLPQEVTDHIVEKTDGVPLFVEELTKWVLDSGVLKQDGGALELHAPLATLDIPDTLQDSLAARLDRLGAAKDVAQLGATLGREFSYDLLTRVAELSEETLQTSLEQLVRADLLHQRGVAPRVRYTFRHALIQDAAYQSLLRSTRQKYHQQIGEVLEADTSVVETHPELLAHHFTEAGQNEQAIEYWQAAGQNARTRSANSEAITHLSRGIELVEKMDASPHRDRLELSFQAPLGVALIAAKGYAAPEVGRALDRARQLSWLTGNTKSLFLITRGTWAWRVVRAEFGLCGQLSEELLHLAATSGRAEASFEARFAGGLTGFYVGNFSASREHCQRGLELYDAEMCRQLAGRTGQNDGVTMQCYLAWSLWCLGYPDQGLNRMNQAINLARQEDHPYSLCYALAHLGRLQEYCRLGESLLETADELCSLATEFAFPFWQAVGRLQRARADFHRGDLSAASQQVENALDAYQSTGAKLSLPYYYSQLAETALGQGHLEEAERLLGSAMKTAQSSHERAYDAELQRLQGELMQHRSDFASAEAHFRVAIQTARDQQAKSWELRAAASLQRLLQSRGTVDDTTERFAETVHWFTEGHALPDYQAAIELL